MKGENGEWERIRHRIKRLKSCRNVRGLKQIHLDPERMVMFAAVLGSRDPCWKRIGWSKAVVGNLFTTTGRKRVVILVAGRTHYSSTWNSSILFSFFLGGGATWIWKWRCTYWRTKTGGSWCRISWEKGVISCGIKKKKKKNPLAFLV